MYLVSTIVRNFIESIDEDDIMQIEAMQDEQAVDRLCEIYENTYGAQPSGVAMFLLKSKFQLAGAQPPAALVA